MTMNRTDDDSEKPLVNVLASMRRADMILVAFLVCSQSLLYWAMWAERCESETDRRRNEQMHREVMQSLKTVTHTMTQSVKVESSRDDMVRKILKMEDNK
jgi:hypothetical protein